MSKKYLQLISLILIVFLCAVSPAGVFVSSASASALPAVKSAGTADSDNDLMEAANIGSDNDLTEASNIGSGNDLAEASNIGSDNYLPESADISGTVADGTYIPDSFSFSGGTGRLTITCEEVTVTDGKAVAELIFSSGNIAYVRSGDETFYPAEQTQKSSTYEIPVEINTDYPIIACTTAMSQPHEIEYIICIEAGTGQGINIDVSKPDIAIEGSGAVVMPEDEQDGAFEELKSEEDIISEENTAAGQRGENEEIPVIEGLEYEGRMDFSYLNCADVYYYKGGYKLIRVYDSADYLIITDNAAVPEGISSDTVIIRTPHNIYMAATGAMALFNAIGGLSSIRFSSVTADNWYVEDAANAMENGDIVYAGKYSAPDFELLVASGCDLAVESTMILHTPKIQEMLEMLGIPVFIDRSSYETHPLGRTEWVKIYGAILDLEDEADAFFKGQAGVLEELADMENTGKTVAFFYINTDGSVVVRRPSDSVPQMIRLAGGKYAMEDSEVLQDSKRSSISITMEEFYAGAVDADYLIYNASIASPVYSIEDLLDKSPLFADFRAVKEGNVWCADKYLYQATDIVGQLIMDFYHMLSDGDESRMTFLFKIK